MLSGKIPIKPLEIGSTKQFREYNIPQFYCTEYETELLLQTKFELIKVQQSLSLIENER